MKKIICILLTTLMLVPMSVGSFAHTDEYTFIIGGEEITISGVSSADEAYEIACLHYCLENGIESDGPTTYCAHEYEYQLVEATTHRARTEQPRCQKFEYSIERCIHCGHSSATLLKTWYTFCCD